MEMKPGAQEIRVIAHRTRELYVAGKGFVDFLGDETSSELDKALGTVSGQLESSFVDPGMRPEPIDTPWLIKLTKRMADASMYGSIDGGFADFTSEYTKLVRVWNELVAKSTELTRELDVAESLTNARPAIAEAARALRKLSEKLIQLNFIETPALNMSRFYLESLQKEREKKEGK